MWGEGVELRERGGGVVVTEPINLQKHSDCRRIDTAIMAALRERGLDERSPASRVLPALARIQDEPPAWCPPKAWETICAYTASYAVAHGSLAVRVALARKREG
jgi:hypothetical protein